jgi:hypothetical protein
MKIHTSLNGIGMLCTRLEQAGIVNKVDFYVWGPVPHHDRTRMMEMVFDDPEKFTMAKMIV